MPLSIDPIAGSIGATVTGLHLRSLDDATFATIHDAWLEHLVLFFPDQHLDPTEQRDFARRFGDLEVHPLNQYAAFAAMSPALQEFLRGLTAVHTGWPHGHPGMKAERPIVLRHPETGRETLAVNRLFTTRIPQLEQSESDAVLAHLFTWGDRPEFTCRWTWSPGDVVIWDNRCTRHYAIGDYDTERIMHRVTVLGAYTDGDQHPARWPDHDVKLLSASSAFVKR